MSRTAPGRLGVQRQYTGTAGRIEHSQVAVYLTYATDHAFIGRQLHLVRREALPPYPRFSWEAGRVQVSGGLGDIGRSGRFEGTVGEVAERAMARGAVPVWTVEASSPKVRSRMGGWSSRLPSAPRMSRARSAGPAWWSSRLVTA